MRLDDLGRTDLIGHLPESIAGGFSQCRKHRAGGGSKLPFKAIKHLLVCRDLHVTQLFFAD
jgi:hypothetical protein